jgi:hypothetical protein
MVDPVFAEISVQQVVQKFGPIGVKRIVARTQLKKSIVNSILHKNRNFNKFETCPMSSKNTRPIWNWSDVKVPLPVKNRVMRRPVINENQDD